MAPQTARRGRLPHRVPPSRRARTPEEFLLRTRAFVRASALGPVAALRTERRRLLLRDAQGRVLAEIAHDSVEAERLAGDRTGGTAPPMPSIWPGPRSRPNSWTASPTCSTPSSSCSLPPGSTAPPAARRWAACSAPRPVPRYGRRTGPPCP
ncbi:hypothetical protein ACFQZC_07660 [Streptacidiphilus monticola]